MVDLKYGVDIMDGLRQIPDESVQCVVTSPPYWGLRDYGTGREQIGLEKTPEEFIKKLVLVFGEVRRTLRRDGTLWLNLGDSYNNSRTGGHGATGGLEKSTLCSPGHFGAAPTKKNTDKLLKPKDLCGIPWRVAMALQADGWYLRSDIIWSKPNPMPESVTDRPTKAHEYVFLLSRSEKYFYDAAAIREKESGVWPGGKCRIGPSEEPHGLKLLSESQSNIRKFRDKQRGHSRRHAGFNERWDKMTRSEQSSAGRNKRTVWEIATEPYSEAHFATFPMELVKPCILAGTSAAGCCGRCGAPHARTEADGWAATCGHKRAKRVPCTVLDPFSGSATTGEVATGLGRSYIGIDINREYLPLALRRLGLFALAT